MLPVTAISDLSFRSSFLHPFLLCFFFLLAFLSSTHSCMCSLSLIYLALKAHNYHSVSVLQLHTQ